MTITPSSARPPAPGPADYFTGTVHVEPLIDTAAPSRVAAARVTFEPGARTAWHTHPLGQTLIVTAGQGLAQSWGGPLRPLHPGDVVWIPPGEKHWHGASPSSPVTHIALHEKLDGTAAHWHEPVSDAQYNP